MPDHAMRAVQSEPTGSVIACACGWSYTSQIEDVFESNRACYDAYAGHIFSLSAASLNATGSPTGRVRGEGPEQSVDAALKVDAPNQRARIRELVRERSFLGMTSKEVAEALGVPNMNSNRASSRLQELWEEGAIALRREHGHCHLGECSTHYKPYDVHLPNAACATHGRVTRRDGAGVWIAL